MRRSALAPRRCRRRPRGAASLRRNPPYRRDVGRARLPRGRREGRRRLGRRTAHARRGPRPPRVARRRGRRRRLRRGVGRLRPRLRGDGRRARTALRFETARSVTLLFTAPETERHGGRGRAGRRGLLRDLPEREDLPRRPEDRRTPRPPERSSATRKRPPSGLSRSRRTAPSTRGRATRGASIARRPSGPLELYHEIEDVHIRALAVGPDGTLYAGTSDRGLVIAIPVQGSPRTLHDFSRPEVTGLAVGRPRRPLRGGVAARSDFRSARPDGHPAPAHADAHAGVRRERKRRRAGRCPCPPRRPPLARRPSPARRAARRSPSFSPTASSSRAGSFPRSRFSASGSTRAERSSWPRGRDGRVYEWKDRRVRLVASTGEKLALAVPAVGSGFAVVTMGAAGILRPDVRSRAVGHVHVRREGCLAPVDVRTSPVGGAGARRSGARRSSCGPEIRRSPTPRGRPGCRSPPTEARSRPVARFFQWKAELKASPKGESPVARAHRSLLRGAQCPSGARESRASRARRRLLPRGDGCGHPLRGEPGRVRDLLRARDAARRRGGDGPGKRLFRKGYRTLTWKGTDPNGDTLRYEVEARREEGSAWFPVRKDLEDTYLSFDTTALSDGRYRFRVTASDRFSQPENEALTAREETGVVVIDNTPPVLKVESKKAEGEFVVVTVLATDALSPVTKAEGAVNADRWRLLSADDGAADSPVERFVFRVPKPPGPAVLSCACSMRWETSRRSPWSGRFEEARSSRRGGSPRRRAACAARARTASSAAASTASRRR